MIRFYCRISKILKENASEYKLLLNNSVYEEIYLFDIVYRIKSGDSLYYKLIDKNKVFEFPEEDKYYKEENETINDLVMTIDDLVGLKISTNLSHDCENVYEILKEKSLKSNLDINFPSEKTEIMKNGLEIYKLKGKKNYFRFELQIKSKFDSAWGDLEHNLFYKDYEYYYLKDNNKKIMNEIGKSIKNIENMMFIIRNAKETFNDEYDIHVFSKNITDIFKYQFDTFWGNTKFIEENIPRLYFLLREYKINSESYEIGREVKDFFQTNVDNTNDLIKSYNFIRNHDTKVIALENIYMNITVDNEMQETDIERFIKCNFEYNFNCIQKKWGYTILIEEEIENIMELISEIGYYEYNNKILFCIKSLNIFYKIKNTLTDELESIYENDEFDTDIEDDTELNDFNKYLSKIVFTTTFTNSIEMERNHKYEINDIKKIFTAVRSNFSNELEKIQNNRNGNSKDRSEEKTLNKEIEILGGIIDEL